MNNSLEKWIQSGLKIGSCVNALDFLGYIGSKCQISQKKLAILVLTKTLRVLSGFTVGFGFFRVSPQKSGSGFGLKKIVEVGFLSGSA